MADALTYAKYFIKNGYDTVRNTNDGNMKLQKLLFFANLISLAELGKPFFDDKILAFTQGCVVENVRLRYRNDLAGLIKDSDSFNPAFTQCEYDILNLCTSIFGKLSAKDLSDLNHEFDFWKRAYDNSLSNGTFKDKHKAVVDTEAMIAEIHKIQNIVSSYRETQRENNKVEIINGIEFNYLPSEISITDEILDELFLFSREADERAYSLYLDGERMVIY